MSKESTFGAEPERLKRLLTAIGLEISNGGEPSRPNASSTTDGRGLMEQPGTRIGRYKLLRMLGEGGMGIVYLAEQQGSIRRRVALKVIKPGMDSARVLARFEAERQTLALLDHPNIAHVYDSGTTEAGRPYFVMEHVKGLSITEHCDHRKLTIKERLQLFQQVCQAVHHAHQKGIIHRDIKPPNILVSIHEDQAMPKIIDFGVAKALSQPPTERTVYTEQGQLFGTPEYMSPEQADMAIEDIDTRSDIYSLGVLLYELLTGALPFDSDTLRGGGIDNIRKVICETDPKTPSTRLTRMGEEAKKVAENRRTEIAALAKCLHRELEWIPLMAMRKERSERYRSASELADDIENYLRGAPLMAGPPTAGYRLRKFLRRHKALVVGIAAVLTVLVTGVTVSTIFAITAKQALDNEVLAHAEAQLIADFLEDDVLGSASRARIGEVTVSYFLDEASKSLDAGRFREKPLVEASIRMTLATACRHLGGPNQAEQHILRAVRIYQQHYGHEHPTTQWSTYELGWIYEDQGQYHEMERTCAKYLEFTQRESGIELQMHCMNGLGAAYWHLGKYEKAESMYEKILQFVEAKDNWLYPWFRCNLARVYASQGRYEEAQRLFEETFKTTVWPEEGHDRGDLVYTSALADTYREQGNYDEAERLFDKTLEAMRHSLGSEHMRTLKCMYGLVRLYVERDRYDEASTLFNEALPIARRRLRKDHPVTLRLVNALAVLHTKQRQYDQAEELFDEAMEGRQSELGNEHPDTLESKNDLAVLYKEQELYKKAEPLLHQAIEGRRLKLGDTHPHTLESWHSLIDLYEAWNKPELANEWRAKLPQIEGFKE